LPSEHGEDPADQRRAVRLLASLDEAPGIADAFDDARAHAFVIRRFGRFPRRQALEARTARPDKIPRLF
jgi:uncharacterized protein (DUF924 family)